MIPSVNYFWKSRKLSFADVLRFGRSVTDLDGIGGYVRRSYLTSSVCLRFARGKNDRKAILASVPALDEGADGEKSVDIDKSVLMTSRLFPNKDTPKVLFDGVTFDSLHVCHIRVHKNNTKLSMADCNGSVLYGWTCGAEGFKNAKKGTNIAAQATAITFCMKSQEYGIHNIRVKIGGLGPGRMAVIKGLQMGGMNIVSISDTTPAEEHAQRPRKQRRL